MPTPPQRIHSSTAGGTSGSSKTPQHRIAGYKLIRPLEAMGGLASHRL
ncbi:hypothetical protein NDI52_25120 [Leptolyngbya sp. PL-A3]